MINNIFIMGKDDLKEFGKVEQCEEIDGMFHIKITEGYSNKISNYSAILNKILDAIGDKYCNVHKAINDKDMFHLILKPNYKLVR